MRHARTPTMFLTSSRTLLAALALIACSGEDPAAPCDAEPCRTSPGGQDQGFANHGSAPGADMAVFYDMSAPADQATEPSTADMALPQSAEDLGAPPAPQLYAPTLITLPRTHERARQYTHGRIIPIENRGDAPLSLGALRLVDAEAASWLTLSWPQPGALHDPKSDRDDGPDTLDPGARALLRLRVAAPPGAGDDGDGVVELLTAHLTLSTDDAHTPEHAITVQANLLAPCAELELPLAGPELAEDYLLDLGALKPGARALHEDIRVSNCSPNLPLVISHAAITRDPTRAFSLKMPDTGRTAPLPITLPPAQSVDLTVSYTPSEGSDMSATGRALVRTDDVGQPERRVALRAAPSTAACPTPEARARFDEAAPWATQLVVPPLKTLLLDASLSSSNGGPPLGDYTWSLITAPEGSHARLREAPGALPNLTKPRVIFLDIPGTYIIELQVSTLTGQLGCSPSRIAVEVVSPHDIYVTTTWETPLDTDPDDSIGADLDLHYLHPLGVFDEAPYDIFWRNQTGDWGPPGPAGDPKLLRDDRDGFGPEAIAHDGPEQGLTYSFGVYAYNTGRFGPSYVTTLLYVRGALAMASRGVELARDGLYLDTGSITWDAVSPTISLHETIVDSP